MAHIFAGTSDLCPEYGLTPHTVAHLFDCLKHPAYLTVYDLWDQTAEAADFVYFISYQLREPDNMIQDDMMGYNINNNIVVFDIYFTAE